MAQEVLVSLSIIIVLATVLTILFRLIRQPPIIAYLIAGIIAGPLVFHIVGSGSASDEIVKLFAHIGVAFLLFIVGLNLDFRVLREVGSVATFAGLAEIIVTGGVGFLIAQWFGFSTIISLYIGAALAFSSTVVVVKILSDKKEIDTLHGKIAVGILIVEDFVAAIALMVIPLLNTSSTFTITPIVKELGIALFLIAITMTISNLFLTRVMNYLARNQEALFLFGISWALILATTFDLLGFSLEIGALIAGMSLASSKYTLELGGKIKPLRDFFVVLFFVFFGSQLVGPISTKLIMQAALFSIFIIIGKPVIVMTILRIFGYKKKTNFLAGSSLAQISEFSLVLTLLGFTLGHLTQEIMSLAILIALITISISSYSMYYSHSLFIRLERLLSVFEGKKFKADPSFNEKAYEVIIFGYHRIGYKMLKEIESITKSVAIVDYNPKVILSLNKVPSKIQTFFGDASDKYFLHELPLDKAKIIISTIPDEFASKAIQEVLKEKGATAVFIATSEQPRIASELYEGGADYVIVPHHLGGETAAKLINKFKTKKELYKKLGKQHYKELQEGKRKSTFS